MTVDTSDIPLSALPPVFSVDGYVVDVLLRDLVGHDRSPAAFLVYLFLWRRTCGASARPAARASASSVRLSHRQIAEDAGLSKSAVQQALRILHRRRLIKSRQRHPTDTPEHWVLRPWAKDSAGSD